MLNVIKYGAISSKTKAMYGKLLKQQDYVVLIQKKSVSEVVSYLKNNTHFSINLSMIDEFSMHRGELENILRQDLFNDYAKLIKFTHGKIKGLINLLYTKVEIETLKIIFRIFKSGHVNEPILEDSLKFMIKYDKLNLQKLAMSRNLDQFVSGLKGSAYYDILRPFVQAQKETQLFSLEMALDLFYLQNIQNAYKNLSTKDAEAVKEYAGLESDIFNIFWIYRSKFFYHTDNKVIPSYTLPLIYKLKKSSLQGLIRANSQEDFQKILDKTAYAFLFKDKSKIFFEHNYSEFMFRVHRARFRAQPFTVSCVISYLRMKEIELSNIISIIEGIRYNLPEENIKDYVVGLYY